MLLAIDNGELNNWKGRRLSDITSDRTFSATGNLEDCMQTLPAAAAENTEPCFKGMLKFLLNFLLFELGCSSANSFNSFIYC